MPTRLYDISPPLTSKIAVFPGDTPLSREMLLDMKKGSHLTLSTLQTTVHVGSHIDGPNHYDADAGGVETWPIERFIGPCIVLDVGVKRGNRIGVEAFERALRSQQRDSLPPRILFQTETWPNRHEWNDDFASIAPALVDHLNGLGVQLVGIDTPSVDPADAKHLETHHRFRAHGMTILEGIVLTDIPPGRYELIALPLKLVGFDGSPVRAVLRTME